VLDQVVHEDDIELQRRSIPEQPDALHAGDAKNRPGKFDRIRIEIDARDCCPEGFQQEQRLPHAESNVKHVESAQRAQPLQDPELFVGQGIEEPHFANEEAITTVEIELRPSVFSKVSCVELIERAAWRSG
jgi:hypothetical protein